MAVSSISIFAAILMHLRGAESQKRPARRRYTPLTDSAYVVGWVIGYAIGVGIWCLLTFWVVRGAILSALAENRRREATDARLHREYELREQIGARRATPAQRARPEPNGHWLGDPPEGASL
ncbi:hypothetical protein [Microbacterium sp. HJ5]